MSSLPRSRSRACAAALRAALLILALLPWAARAQFGGDADKITMGTNLNDDLGSRLGIKTSILGLIDPDTDGIGGIFDNCPNMSNDQSDRDGDGWGDACDACPNTESTYECGEKPEGSWDIYASYIEGCGCTDPDGANAWNAESLTYEGEQPAPLAPAGYWPGEGAICFWPSSSETLADACVDEFTLAEATCSSNGADYEVVACEFGCLGGACSCETEFADSDGGHDSFVRGTTINDHTDQCVLCEVSTADEFGCTGLDVPACEGVGCSVREHSMRQPEGAATCEEHTEVVECLSGCSDGACLPCMTGELDPFENGPGDACAVSGFFVLEADIEPHSELCEVGEVTAIRCDVGCQHGACLCGDTDSAHPHFEGVDSLGRHDYCEGDTLVERWTDSTDCRPQERRVPCAHGCGDGRCLAPRGAPTFTFTCAGWNEDGYDDELLAECRRGVIEFVDEAGIDDFVDVRVDIFHPAVGDDDPILVDEEISSHVARVPGDMVIVMTDRLSGDAGAHGGGLATGGYALAGVRWIVATRADHFMGRNENIPHELGHAFALRLDGTLWEPGVSCETGVGKRICSSVCDEYTDLIGNRSVCANRRPPHCTDEDCWGHLVDATEGHYCYYGDLRTSADAPPSMPERLHRWGFGTPERDHLRRWFELWAARP